MVSKVVILDFRRANLNTQGVSRIPCESSSKGLGVYKNWLLFKEPLLKAQKQANPLCRKSSKQGRRPAWLNKELFLEFK